MTGIKVKIQPQTLLTHGVKAKDELVYPSEVGVELLQQVASLFDTYDIKRGDWPALAVHLAILHEPSCRIEIENPVKVSKTKHITWNAFRLAKLWLDVNLHRRKDKRLSIDRACLKVAKQKDWQDFNPSRQRYNEAKKSAMVQWLLNVQKELGCDEMLRLAAEMDWHRLLRDLDQIEEKSHMSVNSA